MGKSFYTHSRPHARPRVGSSQRPTSNSAVGADEAQIKEVWLGLRGDDGEVCYAWDGRPLGTHGRTGKGGVGEERYRGHPGRKAAIWQILQKEKEGKKLRKRPFSLSLSLLQSLPLLRCHSSEELWVGGFFVISYIMMARFIPRREQTSSFFIFLFPPLLSWLISYHGFGLAQLARSIAPMLACMYHEIERMNEPVSGDR